MIEILKELCTVPTSFGMEGGITDYIEKNYAEKLEFSYDGMGNLTVVKRCGKQNSAKIMLASSIDALGFIVNYIEENGFLRVTPLGNISAVSVAFTELFSEKKVRGFIVPESGAEIKDRDTSKLYIDIGALSKDEAKEIVSLGDVFAPVPSFTELKNGRIGGNGAAVRCPVAIMLKLLRDMEIENADVYFSFCVQNAINPRGARVAAFDVTPDICISLGVCESFDTAGAVKRGEAVLQNGAILVAKATDYCMPPRLRDMITKKAVQENIPHKVCIYDGRASIASVIAGSKSGVECAEICIPARNIGSGAEIFDFSDMENVYKLICKIISQQ